MKGEKRGGGRILLGFRGSMGKIFLDRDNLDLKSISMIFLFSLQPVPKGRLEIFLPPRLFPKKKNFP